MRYDRDAFEQMELWKTYLEDWCEHKPSITVSVKENEWMQVGSWVYDNMDDISGISFLASQTTCMSFFTKIVMRKLIMNF